MARSEEEQEIRGFLRERVSAIAALSWEELDRYGKRTETFTTDAGNSYRVVSYTGWDMGEWASGMIVKAQAYATSGWRRRWPYTEGGDMRGGPDDPVSAPPAGWKRRRWWQRRGD